MTLQVTDPEGEKEWVTPYWKCKFNVSGKLFDNVALEQAPLNKVFFPGLGNVILKDFYILTNDIYLFIG